MGKITHAWAAEPGLWAEDIIGVDPKKRGPTYRVVGWVVIDDNICPVIWEHTRGTDIITNAQGWLIGTDEELAK